MRLARPDVRHPRIVFAGCHGVIEGDGDAAELDAAELDAAELDDAELVAALRARGLHARWLAWDDPETERADLVILRTTRDRAKRDGGERHDEFLAWTRRVPNLLNAPNVVAWNIDEGYLADLDAAGVPTVVQPDDARVAAVETALVFLSGRQSHAFTKDAILPPPGNTAVFDDSRTYESLRPAEPDFELWDVGYAALSAAAAHLGIDPSELLYARVDVMGGRDDPRLRELDLVEPSLGWRRLDEADRDRGQRQFALGVESALDRLGLGPLKNRPWRNRPGPHRRP